MSNLNISSPAALEAENLRQKGNECFKEKKYKKAIEFYTKSLQKMPSALAFSNRAQSYLNLGESDMALGDAKNALKIEPNNIKARFRKASALISEGYIGRWRYGRYFDLALKELTILDQHLPKGDKDLANLWKKFRSHPRQMAINFFTSNYQSNSSAKCPPTGNFALKEITISSLESGTMVYWQVYVAHAITTDGRHLVFESIDEILNGLSKCQSPIPNVYLKGINFESDEEEEGGTIFEKGDEEEEDNEDKKKKEDTGLLDPIDIFRSPMIDPICWQGNFLFEYVRFSDKLFKELFGQLIRPKAVTFNGIFPKFFGHYIGEDGLCHPYTLSHAFTDLDGLRNCYSLSVNKMVPRLVAHYSRGVEKIAPPDTQLILNQLVEYLHQTKMEDDCQMRCLAIDLFSLGKLHSSYFDEIFEILHSKFLNDNVLRQYRLKINCSGIKAIFGQEQMDYPLPAKRVETKSQTNEQLSMHHTEMECAVIYERIFK